MDKILFATRLAELRKARGFTSQSNLAKAYNEKFPTRRRDDAAGNEGNFNGILGTIKNYENPNKNVNPNLNIVCNLCEILDCDIDYLIGKIDVPHHETADIMAATGMTQEAVNRLRGFATRPEGELYPLVLSRMVDSSFFIPLIGQIRYYADRVEQIKERWTPNDRNAVSADSFTLRAEKFGVTDVFSNLLDDLVPLPDKRSVSNGKHSREKE